MLYSHKKIRSIIALALCFVLVTVSVVVTKQVNAESEGGLTITNPEIKVGNEPIEKGQKLKNGDEVSLGFDWHIDNTATDKTGKFSVSLDATGIHIPDVPRSPLYNHNNQAVGNYYIEDGVLYIELNDDYLEESELRGGANISGTVSFEQGSGPDVQNREVSFGGKSCDVEVSFSDGSGLTLSKSADGSAARNSDGSFNQKYKMSLYAWGGSVSDINLQDVPGAGFGGLTGNITAEGQSFDSWEALNSWLGSQTLKSGEQIEISYEMKVDSDVLAQGAENTDAYKNKAKADYKDTKGE